MSKTMKISSKRKELKSGLSKKEHLENLNSSISIAKGMLATLSLGHQSLWTKKLARTEPEHLRILLEEVMEEMQSAEVSLDGLIKSSVIFYRGSKAEKRLNSQENVIKTF